MSDILPVIERTPEPMRYHGPGWTLDFTIRDEYGDVTKPGALYQLWAPQDGVIPDPHGYAEYQSAGWEPREHWAASWQSADGDDGGFVKAGTWRSAVKIFPPKIRASFAATLDALNAS